MCSECLSARARYLCRPSLHRHYPASSLSGPHPRSVVLCQSPFYCRSDILGSVQTPEPRTPPTHLVIPSSLCVARCRLRPRGGYNHSSCLSRLYLLSAFSPIASTTHFRFFRGLLPDSASFASPRNLSTLLVSRPRFGRVLTPFDLDTGWLTRPFPKGFPPS